MPVTIKPKQIAPQSRIKSRTPKSRSRPQRSDTRVGACDPQGSDTEHPRNILVRRRRTLGTPFGQSAASVIAQVRDAVCVIDTSGCEGQC